MYEKNITNYLSATGFTKVDLRAALFDMDGVLYNSMPNHAISWHRAMDKFGIKMAPEEAYLYEGMRGVETIQLLSRQQWGREITEEEAQKMYDEKARIFSTCPHAPVMEGVKELMGKMKANGLTICIVTGSGQHQLLERVAHDFADFVEPGHIVSAFDVKHGKPAPDPYLKGLGKAGCEPWQAIVVENAPMGVHAGAAARIFTVGVNTGPLPNEALLKEGANIVFDNMPAFRDAWNTLYNDLQNI